MTLTQLRYLIAVADCGFNISRAATTLHTSQPGISRQIRVLENQMGTTLLVRDGGRIVRLTENGQRAVAAARRVLNEVRNLTLMQEELMQQTAGRLTIATLHTFALAVLPPVIAQLRARYPDVVIEMKHSPPATMLELVESGEVDIAITVQPPPSSSGLMGLSISTVPAMLIVPAGHPLLEIDSIRLSDLARYPMICHTSLSATTWGMLQQFAANGIELQPAIYATDASVIHACVSEGAGIAVVTDMLPISPKVRKIDVSRLFEQSSLTALLDPHRYHRNFVFEFINALAPSWTAAAIRAEMRKMVFSDAP